MISPIQRGPFTLVLAYLSPSERCSITLTCKLWHRWEQETPFYLLRDDTIVSLPKHFTKHLSEIANITYRITYERRFLKELRIHEDRIFLSMRLLSAYGTLGLKCPQSVSLWKQNRYHRSFIDTFHRNIFKHGRGAFSSSINPSIQLIISIGESVFRYYCDPITLTLPTVGSRIKCKRALDAIHRKIQLADNRFYRKHIDAIKAAFNKLAITYGLNIKLYNG